MLWGWGHNVSGQLGLGGTIDRSVPTQVEDVIDIAYFGRGTHHSIMMTPESDIFVWVGIRYGTLGSNNETENPVVVVLEERVE